MLDVGNAGIATASSVINAQAWEGQVFNVDGNLSSDSIFAVNDISGLPVIDFNATHAQLAFAPYGGNVSIGYTNSGTKLGLKGSTSERVNIIDDQLSDTKGSGNDGQLNIDNGNVQYYKSDEDYTGSVTLDVVSNNGINNDLAIGDSITVVAIFKPNNIAYVNEITVEGTTTNATNEWLGGSAPSSASSGGYDVITATIIKHASAQYVVLCNSINYA